MFAVRAGHLDATRVLLDAGADVDDTVSDGQSALVVAAANANWELAAYLLDRGADVRHAGANGGAERGAKRGAKCVAERGAKRGAKRGANLRLAKRTAKHGSDHRLA